MRRRLPGPGPVRLVGGLVATVLAAAACWENPTFGPDVTTGTVARIDLRPGNVQMVVGEADAVRALVLDSAGVVLQGVPVRWSVVDTTVARVNRRTGQLRGVAPGATQLIASAGDVSASVPVSVFPSFVGPGADHTCALTGAGAACWGRGSSGQLGGGVMEGSAVPVAVGALADPKDLAVGHLHSCALDDERAAVCWGRGHEGQLGHGALGREASPVAVGSGHRYSEIVAGARHTCAVELNGITYCWGWNKHGQLGMGHEVGLYLPAKVQPGRRFHGLAAGGAHTCALGAEDRALCWGRNADGQVGDGTRRERLVPTRVAGDRAYASLAAGSAHTCGLTPEGAAWCWGSDAQGQLGDGEGPSVASDRPVPVAGGHRFEAIVAGAAHTCGLTPEGAAWCWGLGAFGQLGAESGSSGRPVAVHPSLRFRALAAGSGHVCGLTLGGGVSCWGLGTYGQLGQGRRANSAAPRTVSGGGSYRGFGGGG